MELVFEFPLSSFILQLNIFERSICEQNFDTKFFVDEYASLLRWQQSVTYISGDAPCCFWQVLKPILACRIPKQCLEINAPLRVVIGGIFNSFLGFVKKSQLTKSSSSTIHYIRILNSWPGFAKLRVTSPSVFCVFSCSPIQRLLS